MNWLLYIGGGYFWLGLLNSLRGNELKSTQDMIEYVLFLISALSIWIWICWKIIK
jgi:hypothetical protein